MELVEELQRAAPGARVSAQAPDRHAYARDLWPRGLVELGFDEGSRGAPEGPLAIIWPESIEHVSKIVSFARRSGIHLVPFGAGSGVCGGTSPTGPRVVVDMKRFADFSVGPGPELWVGAGALGITLEENLLARGYTIGHYPSSILISTVGGWLAARGAGQCSGRYGKIEDMVTRVEAVLGTGEVLSARRRSSGPDLLPLLVGSEGTLGILTRVGLRLHPAPTARAFAAFSFDSIEHGVRAVRLLFQEGLRPAVARLYDPLDTLLMKNEDETPGISHPAVPPGTDPGLFAAALKAVLRAPSLLARAMGAAEKSLFSRSALVLVHEGDPASVEHEAARAIALCHAARGKHLGEGPARAWYRHRYHVSYRQSAVFRGGAFSDTMEVAAPWSRVLDVYQAVRSALGQHVLVMAHLSHAYADGSSLYFTFAGAPHSGKSALEVYDSAWRAALSAALAAGATLSHHHGVGRSKAPRLGEELGSAIEVVRALKTAWDPSGILNPGALLPPSTRAVSHVPVLSVGEPELDGESCLVKLPGGWSLAAAREWLRERGHELDLQPERLGDSAALSIDAWVGLGQPGEPDTYADPVRTRLAGFSATLSSGLRIQLPTAPRRAVGPDLAALFVGARGRFGRIDAVTLYAPRLGTPKAAELPFEGDRSPALNSSEVCALDQIEAALSRVT